ncbi:MAG TPA: DUF2953 domain-containing protein [Candidatus Mediterraneibacter norfolkensis]|nr:DUF2953 domain-containing protein [Candidatus Mediterraneibacter norfolkensis]
MLHILLLMLKIIGILLLILLGLVLLLFLMISICPLKYRGEVSCQGDPETLSGQLRFHWLFHLIAGEVIYQGGETNWKLRAAWKSMGGVEAEAPDKKEEEKPEEKSSVEEGTALQENRSVKEVEKSQGSRNEDESCENQADQTPEMTVQISEKDHSPDSPADTEEKRRKTARKGHRIREKEISKKQAKKQSFSDRFEKYTKRIKYTFRSFCDKIKSLGKKKNRLKAFVENETHRKAFFRAMHELKRFFRFLRPKKMNVHIEFGCKNPEYTGYFLAGISMIYPMIGEYTQLQPDFDRRILKGQACIEGKFRVIYVLIIAWNLIWDKNVRTTYRHIRKFKL